MNTQSILVILAVIGFIGLSVYILWKSGGSAGDDGGCGSGCGNSSMCGSCANNPKNKFVNFDEKKPGK